MRRLLFAAMRKVVGLLAGVGPGRVWPFREIYRFLLTWLNPRTALVHGHRMYLDPNDTLRLSLWGEYEPFATQLFTDRIESGQTVLDVGANIGYYTLLSARLVGELGNVFAFEPDPDNFALLSRNVDENGYDNVHLENVAVSDSTGSVSLYKAGQNWGGHRIYTTSDQAGRVSVDSTTLDDFFAERPNRVDLIKIDIEGAETRALQGMSRLLAKNRRITLFTEFSPGALRDSGSSAEQYAGMLSQQGFTLFLLDESARELIPAAVEDIVRRTTGDSAPSNLCCVRGN